MNTRHCLVIAFLLLATLAQAQTFSTPVAVSGSANAGAHSPCLVMERDGAMDLSWFQNNGDIWCSRMAAGAGSASTAPVHVSRQITTNPYVSLLQRVPQMAVDTKGVIHMIWMEDRLNKQSDVFYSRSTDHGATWSLGASIMDPDDSSKYAQDFPHIAIDSSDNIYVAFLDNRYLMRKTFTNYKLLVLRSNDHGATWLGPTVASNLPKGIGGTCECCTLDIVAAKSGSVYIAYRSNINDRRDIWLSRSTDRAKTFDQSILVQSGVWMLPGCPTTGPMLTLDDNENAIITWRDSRQSVGRDICYTSVLPYGTDACLPNKAVSRTTNQSGNWPKILRGPDNALAVLYQANSSGTNQLRSTLSTDGGNTWTSDVAIDNTSTADQQQVCAVLDSKRTIHAVWQDSRSNGTGIYYATSSLPIVVSPSNPKLTAPLNAVVPDSRGVNVSWAPPTELSGSPFVWYDFVVTSPVLLINSGIQKTSLLLPITTEGTYDYTLTMFTLAGASAAQGTITIQKAGVDAKPSVSALELYPNPSNGRMIYVRRSQSGNATMIRVYDAIGRNCLAHVVEANFGFEKADALDLSGLGGGSYTIIVEDATGNRLVKGAVVLE